MTNQDFHNTDFDKYAEAYDGALSQGLSVTGEDKHYFARGRIAWLADCLRLLQATPKTILDVGCGTGSAVPAFLDLLQVESVLGLDISLKSLDVAKRAYGSESAQFLLFSQYQPCERIDLAFCNGVFHHVPLSERAAVVNYVHRALRPGGVFALWENNPWNPATRYVMRRIPFDRDAIMLPPPQARRLLRTGGFEILRTDFLFIFPRILRRLRGIEPLVARLPFGAQYQILCRKL